MFRIAVETGQVRLWHELLVLAQRALEDWRRKAQERTRAPEPAEKAGKGGKAGKGDKGDKGEAPAAEEQADVPGDLRAFLASTLRGVFGGLREMVAPPTHRGRRRKAPAPSRGPSAAKLTRGLSRRMTVRSGSVAGGPSNKSDMLERVKQASRMLAEESLFGVETTEEAGERQMGWLWGLAELAG